MSLNGLDATVVNEAYQAALIEGGGWVLLNYTTRDEVTIFGRGSGGLVEVKEAVDRYEERLPLYGFINYRRRKVILKYMPEGTSRVLQARVAVHFQSVVEKFAPNDTTFAFSASAELKDSTLSKACSLHTASASIKSSCDSLRQKGLAEIAEDAQESQSALGDDQAIDEGNIHRTGSGNTRARTATPKENIDDQNHQRPNSAKRTPSPSRSSRTIRNTDKALPPTPPEPGLEGRDLRASIDEHRPGRGPSLDVRSSFQSTPPQTRDLHSPYGYKPKVKLGPRPSTDLVNRLHIEFYRHNEPRPVSTLPSSIRLPLRKTAPTRSRSQHSQKSSLDRVLTKASLSPPLPVLPVSVLSNPNLDSSSNVKVSGANTSARPIESKSPSMTPEKRRLMKALQLRQKQLAAQALMKSHESEPPPAESILQPAKTVQTPNNESLNTNRDDNSIAITENKGDVEPALLDTLIKDASDSNLANFESSPISVLEASDGQSTQASSITDEEELQLSKAAEPKKGSMHLILNTKDLQAENEVVTTPLTAVNIKDPSPSLEQDRPITTLFLSVDRLNPYEVPLPPISVDEEFSLNHDDTMSDNDNTCTSTVKSAEGDLSASLNHAPFLHAEDDELNLTRPSTGDTMEYSSADRLSIRHDLPRSVRRISSHENSDDHFLSDDSFMEELGSATVQEAKPISVSKSPITPFFPKYPTEQQWNEFASKSRSVSSLLEDGNKDEPHKISPRMPPVPSSRSLSASQVTVVEPQQVSAITLKKVGVSTGISQRIKALEKLSSRPTSPSSQVHPTTTSPGVLPASVSLRKASLRVPQVGTDLSKNSGKAFHQKFSSLSSSSSPEADSLGSKSKFINVKATSKSKRYRPESISVIAKIVRDPQNLMPAVPMDPSESITMDLYKSPLVVEHQNAQISTNSPPLKPPRSKFNLTRSASSSSIERKSEPPQATRRESFTSRRSARSRRGSEVDLRSSISDTSSSGMAGLDGIKEDKKESRKSRLFKRMSTISSASRRSIVYAFNSPVKQQPIVEHHEITDETPSAMADFGDVNIQFPDTLLWKRRDMKIDDQGNLVLSSSKADNNSRVATKRYPLSEFHAPYIPDQDRQELPNSVVLDFKDGSTLQTACENFVAQAELLKALKQAYHIYNAQQ